MVSPTSRILRATAPSIAGIESRKEYSAAVFAGIPKNSASEIVVPEREMPGVIAQPCAIPMSGACHVFKFSVGLSVCFLRSRGNWRITPVRINMILTMRISSKKDSNCVLKTTAMIPVEMEPRSISHINLSSVEVWSVALGCRQNCVSPTAETPPTTNLPIAFR